VCVCVCVCVCEWGKECGILYRSVNPHQGVQVGIEERGLAGIEYGIE